MASTATSSVEAAEVPDERAGEGGLARTRRSRQPDRVGVATERVGEPADLAGAVAPTLDDRQQPSQRGAVATARRVEQLLRIPPATCHRRLDRHDLGHTLDAVLHDPFDARLEGGGRGGARAARPHERHGDHAAALVDVAQEDVAAVRLEGGANRFDGLFDLGSHEWAGRFLVTLRCDEGRRWGGPRSCQGPPYSGDS